MNIDWRSIGSKRISLEITSCSSPMLEKLLFLLGNLPPSPNTEVLSSESSFWENSLTSFQRSVWAQLEPKFQSEYLQKGRIKPNLRDISEKKSTKSIRELKSNAEEFWDYKKINWDET